MAAVALSLTRRTRFISMCFGRDIFLSKRFFFGTSALGPYVLCSSGSSSSAASCMSLLSLRKGSIDNSLVSGDDGSSLASPALLSDFPSTWLGPEEESSPVWLAASFVEAFWHTAGSGLISKERMLLLAFPPVSPSFLTLNSDEDPVLAAFLGDGVTGTCTDTPPSPSGCLELDSCPPWKWRLKDNFLAALIRGPAALAASDMGVHFDRAFGVTFVLGLGPVGLFFTGLVVEELIRAV